MSDKSGCICECDIARIQKNATMNKSIFMSPLNAPQFCLHELLSHTSLIPPSFMILKVKCTICTLALKINFRATNLYLSNPNENIQTLNDQTASALKSKEMCLEESLM